MIKKKKLKLIFDFDVSKNLEVFHQKLNDWFRVTAEEFRSWNGKRRINNQEYEGLVYIYETNKVASDLSKSGIIFVDGSDPRIFKCRPGERHFIEQIKKEKIEQKHEIINNNPIFFKNNG